MLFCEFKELLMEEDGFQTQVVNYLLKTQRQPSSGESSMCQIVTSYFYAIIYLHN